MDSVQCSHVLAKQCCEYFTSKVLSSLGGHGWIAGGCIREWWISRSIKNTDVDIWFPNEASVAFAKDKALSHNWKLTKETAASINFSTSNGIWVQLIKKCYFPTPADTIAAFDFTVCCAAVSQDGLIHHQDFFADLAAKRLAFNEILYPLSTLDRVRKYVAKGFTLCPDQNTLLMGRVREEFLSGATLPELQARYME